MSNDAIFGFGCMRLPQRDENDPTTVNQEEFNKMVDYYIEKGFNYFDTSYAYHDGQSEIAIKKAVVDRYPRESYQIADKMPTWLLTGENDNEKFVNEMLERLGIDYFDKFFIHNINAAWLPRAEKANSFEFIKNMKKEGLAKQIGFSFHDDAKLLKEFLEKYGDIFDFAQLELNYLDWEDPIIEAHKCYDLCSEYGLDVYVMEPLKGGVIINTTDEIKNDFKEFNPDETIASLALRFCASLDNVMVVLSGMSNMENTIENCATFENFKKLTDNEFEFLIAEAEKLRSSVAVPCSECNYCINYCPCAIPIPEFFSIYNAKKQNEGSNIYTAYYHKLANEKVPASVCTNCQTCIPHCTQKINIPDELKKVDDIFKEGFNPYGR